MGNARRKKVDSVPTEMTVEEFLVWEGDGTDRVYELVDGNLRAMAPASVTHGVIMGQIIYLLRGHCLANGLPCMVVGAAGVKPRVNANSNVRIPDISVTCSKSADDRLLSEPVLAIEIVSPGNKAKTWTNVWAYTTIPSVLEILIVGSTKRDVKLLRRQADGTWPDTPDQIDIKAKLNLECLGFAVPVKELYDGSRLAV
jgi:Uma2 family endonuclease